MNFDLKKQTIFLTVTGSTAYGTNIAGSDVDVRGIAVQPLEQTVGFLHTFEQADGVPISSLLPSVCLDSFPDHLADGLKESKDVSIMDLRKFCKLAADGNPNVLEMLFIEPKFWLMFNDSYADLHDIREAFLSTKCRYTFAGYAHAQLKRIRTHRQYLLNPPKCKPERSTFGLPDFSPIPANQWKAAVALVDRQIESWLVNPDEEIPVTVLSRIRESLTDLVATMLNTDDGLVRAAGKKLGFDDNLVEHLVKEKSYHSAMQNWKSYESWKVNRNPVRAAMEAKFSYDAKHGMHLVRLLRMGAEILEKGTLTVCRPDAEELKAIRAGAWSFEQLEEYADRMDKHMESLMKTTKLQRQSDRKLIDKTCVDIILGR